MYPSRVSMTMSVGARGRLTALPPNGDERRPSGAMAGGATGAAGRASVGGATGAVGRSAGAGAGMGACSGAGDAGL